MILEEDSMKSPLNKALNNSTTDITIHHFLHYRKKNQSQHFFSIYPYDLYKYVFYTRDLFIRMEEENIISNSYKTGGFYSKECYRYFKNNSICKNRFIS